MFNLANFDLKNVAKNGIATQSSYSKWSSENEAQRALFSHDKEFAFHTDREKGKEQWWGVELDTVYPIYLIEISNRRNKKYYQDTRFINVEISVNKTDWVTVYSGGSVFGAHELDDVPLFIPILNNFCARYLRIRNKEGQFLYLSNVKVYVDSKHILPSPLCVLANRTDGLGERIKAILKGIVLADILGVDFKFSWAKLGSTLQHDTFHSVVEKEKIFSAKFIERYYIDPPTPNSNFLVTEKEVFSLGKENLSNCIINVANAPLESISEEVKASISEFTYVKAFENIEFSPKYKEILDYSKQLVPSTDCIAFHLRAGDIVYGVYSDTDRFSDKVVPFGLVEKMISDNTDKTIFVFGQDFEQLSYLKDKYGVMLAHELAQKYSGKASELAFFEMCLMSKFKRIIGFPSAFSFVPSMIGGGKVEHPLETYSRMEVFKVVSTSLEDKDNVRYSIEQKFHSIIYLFKLYSHEMSSAQKRFYILTALSLRPDSWYFRIQNIINAVYTGEMAEAESSALTILKTHSDEFLEYVRNSRFFLSSFGIEVIEQFKELSGNNRYIDSFLYLLLSCAEDQNTVKHLDMTSIKAEYDALIIKEA